MSYKNFYQTCQKLFKSRNRIFKLKFFSAFLFLAFLSWFLSTPLLAEDNYVKKQYMLIPWGGGKGQLSLSVGVSRPILQYGEDGSSNVYGKPVTDRYGPKFLVLDDNGNFFIYDYDGKQSTVKKFDSSGRGIAELITKNPPDEFSIQGDEILTKTNYANKITILDPKDLSILKEIDVPKNEIDMFHEYGTHLKKGGLIITYSSKKERIGKVYIYNQSDWTRFGKNEYDQEKSKPSDQNGISSVIETHRSVWAQSIGKQLFGWSVLSRDESGNYYVKASPFARYFDGKLDIYIFKVDIHGNILFAFEVHRDNFLSFASFGEVPVLIDKTGNIYEAWGDENGLHIDKYQYLNHENKK